MSEGRRVEADDPEVLMAVLRRERRRLGLSQEDMAKPMGVSARRVSAIENCPADGLEIRTLIKYVQAMGGRLRLEVEFE